MSTETTNQPQTVKPDDPAQPVLEEHGDATGVGEKDASPVGKKDDVSDFIVRIFTVLLYSGIALAIAWFAGGKDFIIRHWIKLGIAALILLVVATVPTTRRWVARATPQRRIGMTLTGSTVIIIGLVFLVYLVEPRTQAALLRTVFLIVVCSLPAIMYYLFIATKKYSLFNEFIMNLNRLGLLDPSRVPADLVCYGLVKETEPERKNRIRTYVQRFEAVYGAVPTDLGGLMLEPTDTGKSTIDPQLSKMDSMGFANIFTYDTITPVILATVLIVLGWLITLPPWEGKLQLGRLGNQTTAEAQSAGAAGGEQAATNAPAQPAPAAGSQVQGANSGAQPPSGTKLWLDVLSPVATPERFAFIGAYFFSLQLIFRRYVRRDLRASAYVATSLRVILAVIGIWVVGQAEGLTPWLSGRTLLVLGFVIGVFPRVAWQVIQAAISRAGSLVLPSLQTQLPISDLDGLTVWHEARFEEEDVENIPNMATADLVDLMINTRFPPDRIIDWMDQAILYTHLGPELDGGGGNRRSLLRVHGIRTATSLIEAYNRSESHGDRPDFETIFEGTGRNPIRSLVDVVGTNPNLKLIQTWRGLHPHVHTSAPPPG